MGIAGAHARTGVTIAVLLLCASAQAQEMPVNFTGWYGYEGYHPFEAGEPWGLFGEGYIKRNDHAILEPMQYFVRLGVNYSLRNGNRLTGGLAYQYNLPYDEASEPYSWPDYRIWEQFMIRRPGPKGMWVHRFRMEQRWLGRKDDPSESGYSEYDFENTFRYMLRRTFRFGDTLYAIAYGEVHLRLPPPDSDKLFDQNRVYLGLGINLDRKKEWRIETGYMLQQVFEPSVEATGKKRVNHVFRVSLTSDAPFAGSAR